jgi:hypothetical protein
VLEELTNILNQSGSEWAFAREPYIIERDCERGKDIDIWCESGGLFSIMHLLFSNDWYLNGGRHLGKLGQPHTNLQLRFKKRRSNGPVLDVAVGSLRWWLIVYLDESIVRRNVLKNGEVPYLKGVALLSILITRVALRGELNGERLLRARRALESATTKEREQWLLYSIGLFGQHRAYRMLMLIQSSGSRLSSHFKFSLIIKALLSSVMGPRLLIAGAIRTGYRRIASIIHRQIGVIICLIGTDGTGKTTLAYEIRDALNGDGYKAKYLYMGRAKNNTKLIENIRHLVLHYFQIFPKNVEPDSDSNSERENLKKARVSIFLHNFAAVLYWSEYWCRQAIKLRIGCMNKTNFILDRGAFDLLVMPHLWNNIRRLIKNIPIPDALILCDAPTEEIYHRKQERNLADIKIHQSVYRNIATKLFYKIPVLHLITIEAFREFNSQLSKSIVLSVLFAKKGSLDIEILQYYFSNFVNMKCN